MDSDTLAAAYLVSAASAATSATFAAGSRAEAAGARAAPAVSAPTAAAPDFASSALSPVVAAKTTAGVLRCTAGCGSTEAETYCNGVQNAIKKERKRVKNQRMHLACFGSVAGRALERHRGVAGMAVNAGDAASAAATVAPSAKTGAAAAATAAREPAAVDCSRICLCLGFEHGAYGICLFCGKVACNLENSSRCYFCGNRLKVSVGARDVDETAAVDGSEPLTQQKQQQALMTVRGNKRRNKQGRKVSGREKKAVSIGSRTCLQVAPGDSMAEFFQIKEKEESDSDGWLEEDRVNVEDRVAMITARKKALEKAMFLKDRLVYLDETSALRSVVYDDAADWFEEASNQWISNSKRAEAAEMHELELQFDEKAKSQTLLTVDLAEKRVIDERKLFAEARAEASRRYLHAFHLSCAVPQQQYQQQAAAPVKEGTGKSWGCMSWGRRALVLEPEKLELAQRKHLQDPSAFPMLEHQQKQQQQQSRETMLQPQRIGFENATLASWEREEEASDEGEEIKPGQESSSVANPALSVASKLLLQSVHDAKRRREKRNTAAEFVNSGCGQSGDRRAVKESCSRQRLGRWQQQFQQHLPEQKSEADEQSRMISFRSSGSKSRENGMRHIISCRETETLRADIAAGGKQSDCLSNVEDKNEEEQTETRERMCGIAAPISCAGNKEGKEDDVTAELKVRDEPSLGEDVSQHHSKCYRSTDIKNFDCSKLICWCELPTEEDKISKTPTLEGATQTSSASRIGRPPLAAVEDKGMCISVRQPFASLIVAGFKTREGRNWPCNYRGRLWIHAAAAPPDSNLIQSARLFYEQLLTIYLNRREEFLTISGFSSSDDIHQNPLIPPLPTAFPTSAVLGCVMLAGCCRKQSHAHIEFPEKDNAFTMPDESEGYNYELIFVKPRRLTVPVKMKGGQKLWKIDPSKLAYFQTALERPRWPLLLHRLHTEQETCKSQN